MTSSKSGRRVGFASAVSLAISVWAATSVGAQSPGASSEPRLGEGLRIGLVTHVVDDPFMQQVIDGAKAAAADTGVELTVAGPGDGAGNPQLIAIEKLVEGGIQGIATSVPGDSMSGALNELDRFRYPCRPVQSPPGEG